MIHIHFVLVILTLSVSFAALQQHPRHDQLGCPPSDNHFGAARSMDTGITVLSLAYEARANLSAGAPPLYL